MIGPFPRDYRRFLAEFGWAAVLHFEINGVGPDVPHHLDLVQVTLDERKNFGLPPHLIPVMNDGGGNLYCFEGGRGGSNEQILFWDHETSHASGPTVVAESFSAWLERLIA